MSKRINFHLLWPLAFLLILCLDNAAYQKSASVAVADSITQAPVATPSCLPISSPLSTAQITVLAELTVIPSVIPSTNPSLTPAPSAGTVVEDGGLPLFPDRTKDLVLVRPSPVKMTSTDTVAAAQKMMQILLGPTEYACFDHIIWIESHWNPTAVNAKNGACGLGQSSPCSKMENAVPDWPVQPSKQVKWFLSYINRRYGSSCNAWAFWNKNGWY